MKFNLKNFMELDLNGLRAVNGGWDCPGSFTVYRDYPSQNRIPTAAHNQDPSAKTCCATAHNLKLCACYNHGGTCSTVPTENSSELDIPYTHGYPVTEGISTVQTNYNDSDENLQLATIPNWICAYNPHGGKIIHI